MNKEESLNTQKYSYVTNTKFGYTVMAFYPDRNGMDTLLDIYNWESADSANRTIVDAKDKDDAQELLKTFG